MESIPEQREYVRQLLDVYRGRRALRAWCAVQTVCSRLNCMSAVFRLKRLKTHWLLLQFGVWRGPSMRRRSGRSVRWRTFSR